MRRFSRILATGVAVAAVTAVAATAGVVFEVEVSAIDAKSWTVRLQPLEGGEPMEIELPPENMVGVSFNAAPPAPEPGQRFSAIGPPGQPVLRGVLRAGPKERPGKERGRGRGGKRFSGRYRVVGADPDASTLEVLDQETEKVWTVQVDVEAFVGYRFGLDVDVLRPGSPVAVIAPEKNVIERCCTWLER